MDHLAKVNMKVVLKKYLSIFQREVPGTYLMEVPTWICAALGVVSTPNKARQSDQRVVGGDFSLNYYSYIYTNTYNLCIGAHLKGVSSEI